MKLYAFGDIFPEGRGETKDLRVEWALHELALPYEVVALDQTAGDLDAPAFTAISPFHQIPVLDDDGFVLTESAAIVLYLAEKAGKLLGRDAHDRTRVTQWCFAAVSTVAPTLQAIEMNEMFDPARTAATLHAQTREIAARWFRGVEQRLAGRAWIVCADFTVADIVMASVLRTIRKTDLMDPYPQIRAYFERCHARPAWERALAGYAARMGITVDDIR